MTRKGLRSACTVFAITAPERAELSYEKNLTLDSVQADGDWSLFLSHLSLHVHQQECLFAHGRRQECCPCVLVPCFATLCKS